MIKRALFILVALIPCLTFAQRDLGEWKSYSRYTKVTQMEQTSDKIYFLSGNSLYSYDKNTNESYTYTSLNKLSDNTINSIYYNNNGKYLLIAYQTGNIDLLYDDGKVVNISNIKDAVLTFSPNIVDVAFSGEYIYIATKFGLVVYDESKQKVKTTGIYNKEISFVTCVGDYIVVDQNHALYYIHKDGDFNSFNNFTQISSGYWMLDMEGLNNNMLLFRTTGKSIYIFELNFSNNSYKRINLAETTNTSLLIKGKDEYYYLADNILYSVNKEGVKSTHSTMPSTLVSQSLSIWDNPNKIWAGDVKGIANYDISGESTTVLYDKFKPQAISVDIPCFITSDKNGKVYVSNKSESVYLHLTYNRKAYISTIDNTTLEDVTPTEITASHKSNPNKEVLYDIYQLAVDPEDTDIFYVGSYWEGLYKVKDGKTISQYNPENSTLNESWGCRVNAVAFDKENNLWCTNEIISEDEASLHILPAEARKKETTAVKDWIPIKLGGFKAQKDVQLLICKKSNMIFLCDGKWCGYLVAYDTKGTYTDTSDDEYMLWNSFIDQDGKTFTPVYTSALVEDEKGRVWVGSTEGIIEISNPRNAINKNMTINRLKVPRNDGTNYADYLLDAIHVTSISVDNSNRKWVGTMDDGVYLVNETGSQILEHFTSENSYFPGGNTYKVYAHPLNNKVYIGTQYGLAEYSSYSSPAKEDYTEIYAYPNPVKPDYTGLITITGLMDNSLVKIADSAGNVFHTTRSEGGMATWDGCNSAGERVKSGVYFVFVSQSENDQASGAVTKIMIIN